LICLEDGKHFKSLKRRLVGHGLMPEQYRAKWKFPSDYPMVAAYTRQRGWLRRKRLVLDSWAEGPERANADARQSPVQH
jgi:predicted transcriptional regulator